VALDFPAAGLALWSISDQLGLRPEYLLPVAWHESAFNPAVQNSQGAGYYGVTQNSAADIQSYAGVSTSTYQTWQASQQLSTVTLGYFKNIIAQYGPLRSGTKCYQAEYLPATLKTATALSSVIASKANDPNGFYAQNTSLDANNDGQITLQDLANVVTAAAATAQVSQAIAQTYSLRPWEIPLQRNPALGDDFGFPWGTALSVAAILGGSLAVAYFIANPQALPRPLKRILT
jgi:hypothetical protein